MTRELTVTAEFERGTLIEATADDYVVSGKDHVYYVPDRAQRDAGMQKVRTTETSDAYRDEETGFDWDTIQELVSPIDIVERAEQDTINRTSGDVGKARRRSPWFSSRGADEDVTVPSGVIKFADPEADDEGGANRNPVERGLLWGTLKDRVLVNDSVLELQYQNDTQQANTRTARIPVAVLSEGIETIVAYLAAHDHIDSRIAHALQIDSEDVQEIVEEYTIEVTT